jgi:endonuclease/exonuclease/phosphatase family metal-dependent hydrolase
VIVRCRVVVYNLKGFRLGRGPVTQVLRELAPDLVLVQESGPRRRLRRLARDLGMTAAADPWSPFRRRVKSAVLTGPSLGVRASRLVRFPGSERLHPRGVLVAELASPAGRLWAASGHLGLVPAERAAHAERVADLLVSLEGPVVFGADLNELPDATAAARIARVIADAWTRTGARRDDVVDATFPADGPTHRIDYLFVSDDVRVASVRVAVEAGMASDHLPVVADVAIEGAGSLDAGRAPPGAGT